MQVVLKPGMNETPEGESGLRAMGVMTTGSQMGDEEMQRRLRRGRGPRGKSSV